MNRIQSIPCLNRGVGITANRSMGCIFNKDMKSQVSLNIIELKESIITKYDIGADVQSNNTELSIEQRGKIVARYSVPTTITAISKSLIRSRAERFFPWKKDRWPAGSIVMMLSKSSKSYWLFHIGCWLNKPLLVSAHSDISHVLVRNLQLH